MTDTVKVYKKDGTPIAEIEADVTRAWLLNGVGRASFILSTRDPKCTIENLEFGNYVTVESDKLPVWGGVIDTPRQWGGCKVTVNCYSGEQVLGYRRGLPGIKYTGTAGAIFEQIINLANKQGATLAKVGDIFTGGIQRQETVQPEPLLDTIIDISERSLNDFYLAPEFDENNNLYFSANWYEVMGEYSDVALIEGLNIQLRDPIYEEQGTIINDLLGKGQSATWNSKSTYQVQNAASISRFGLRQASRQFQDVTSTGTLKKNTENAVSDECNPKRTFNLSALDEGALFYNLRLGNTFDLSMFSVGFNGIKTTVRLSGMQYTPSSGKVDLTVYEVD